MTICIPPWHPARHTAPPNAICTPKHSTPTPHPSTPHCHTSCLAHPAESFNLDEMFCSPLSMFRNSRPAPHITLLCPHDQDLFSLCLFASPSSFLCFFGCDLLACVVHLIFSFLCKISLSLSLRPSPSLFLSPLSIPLFLSLSLPVALSRSLAIFV